MGDLSGAVPGEDAAGALAAESMSAGQAARTGSPLQLSPRRSIDTPARVIWWVSGGGSLGGVRAMSWLDKVDTGDPRRLHHKCRDRGVLDEQQVLDSAKRSGKSGNLVATALLLVRRRCSRRPSP